MNNARYIILFLLLILLGLIGGLLITLVSGSAKGQGLAAGGIIAFNALTGMVAGLVVAILTSINVRRTAIGKVNILIAVLTIALIAVLAIVISMSKT